MRSREQGGLNVEYNPSHSFASMVTEHWNSIKRVLSSISEKGKLNTPEARLAIALGSIIGAAASPTLEAHAPGIQEHDTENTHEAGEFSEEEARDLLKMLSDISIEGTDISAFPDNPDHALVLKDITRIQAWATSPEGDMSDLKASLDAHIASTPDADVALRGYLAQRSERDLANLELNGLKDDFDSIASRITVSVEGDENSVEVVASFEKDGIDHTVISWDLDPMKSAYAGFEGAPTWAGGEREMLPSTIGANFFLGDVYKVATDGNNPETQQEIMNEFFAKAIQHTVATDLSIEHMVGEGPDYL